MQQHLENSEKQKNRIEQIILKLGHEIEHPKSFLSQVIPRTSNITKKEETFQNSGKIKHIENFNDNLNLIVEDTELTKIKQDFLIEYDEKVAYETLVHIAEMTVLSQKNDILRLLKENVKEEESMILVSNTCTFNA